MTKNLKIHLLSQQITDLLNQTDLEAGVIVLILKNLAIQAELVLNEQINKDYQDYLKELQQQIDQDQSGQE